MTLQIFTMLVIIFSITTGLLTEAIKKFYSNAEKKYSSNLIALICALIVGGGGSVAAYIFLSIPFTLVSITALIIMIIIVWIGAMIGFDKITQLLKQIEEMKI